MFLLTGRTMSDKAPLYAKWPVIIKIIKIAGIRPIHIIFPIIASFVMASVEGLATILLFPIVKGVISLDFSFLKTTPVIKNIIFLLPAEILESNTALLILVIGIFFSMILLKNGLKYCFAVVEAYQSRTLSSNIKNEIFKRYLSFGKLFYDRTHLSYLLTVIQSDSQAVIHAIKSFTGLLQGFFVLLVYLAILFKISWVMTLCSLLLIPVLDISLRWLINKIRRASIYSMKARQSFQQHLYNTLLCMTLVKSYQNQAAEIKEFAIRQATNEKFSVGMTKKQALINPIQEVLTAITVLIIAVAMFITVSAGRARIEGFFVFFYVLKRSTAQFAIFNSAKTSVATLTGPLLELDRIFNDSNKFFVESGGKHFPGLNDRIEVKDLTFAYIPGHPVLKDLACSMEKNKFTAIVGASGSGKTTLVSLIMRFYDCPAKSIFIDGNDIRDYSLKTLLKNIALVSQDTLLFADTIKNNIAYGMDKNKVEKELPEILKKAQLHDFVAGLPDGLDTFIGERGIKLSGGERQRVAIARALLKDPEILILDEATSSLDSHTESMIQEALAEAVKGKTAIVIAHRLSTIKKADKILVLEHGRVVEAGSLNELLDKKGKFFEYWEKQKFF